MLTATQKTKANAIIKNTKGFELPSERIEKLIKALNLSRSEATKIFNAYQEKKQKAVKRTGGDTTRQMLLLS